MRGCSADCEAHPACDFCLHFVGSREELPNGVTIKAEDGWCSRHLRETYLGAYCDDFWCKNVPVEGEADFDEDAL